jgi:flagellar motor switch protein FliN
VKTFLDCWAGAASGLLPQALTGAPEWVETSPVGLPGPGFGFLAEMAGECRGALAVWADAGLLEVPLLGENLDQKNAWSELLREIAEAAAGELTAGGVVCRLASFAPWNLESGAGTMSVSRAFEIRSGTQSWKLLVRDAVELPGGVDRVANTGDGSDEAGLAAPRPSLELLLDVELEAALRFGSREMTLGEILDLGPGDVVQLDRHVSDPVDLIVADKIVARGEVVLVNGNFGLRVTEVAAPRKRLESIRCLF